MQYQIVRADDADELEGYVRAAIDEGGWVPLGGVTAIFCSELRSDKGFDWTATWVIWAQAMTRSEQ